MPSYRFKGELSQQNLMLGYIQDQPTWAFVCLKAQISYSPILSFSFLFFCISMPEQCFQSKDWDKKCLEEHCLS
jgi:hypothetical protein